MLVNIKILTSTSNFTFYSFFFTISSILSFPLLFLIISSFEFADTYKLFSTVFLQPLNYLALFFTGAALVLVDNGLHLAQHEVEQWIEVQEKLTQRRLKYLIDQDRAI